MTPRADGKGPLEVGKFLKVISEHTADRHGAVVGLKKTSCRDKTSLAACAFPSKLWFLNHQILRSNFYLCHLIVPLTIVTFV